jgi:hypothetical protein
MTNTKSSGSDGFVVDDTFFFFFFMFDDVVVSPLTNLSTQRLGVPVKLT